LHPGRLQASVPIWARIDALHWHWLSLILCST
jgi:hypothetical protein